MDIVLRNIIINFNIRKYIKKDYRLIVICYRDGSAVELIGLSASCLLWLHNLNEEGLYPYSGVKLVKHGKFIIFGQILRIWSLNLHFFSL